MRLKCERPLSEGAKYYSNLCCHAFQLSHAFCAKSAIFAILESSSRIIGPLLSPLNVILLYLYPWGNIVENGANLQSGHDKVRRTCIYLQTWTHCSNMTNGIKLSSTTPSGHEFFGCVYILQFEKALPNVHEGDNHGSRIKKGRSLVHSAS